MFFHRLLIVTGIFTLCLLPIATKVNADVEGSVQLIVMDPLSKPLSCDCVEGYAQRNYEALGKYLEKRINKKVVVTWNASLVEAIKDTNGKADLIVGKYSVIMTDATKLNRVLQPIASLTDTLGEVTQKGLVVVRRDDVALGLADLAGYKLLLGNDEAEEKSTAILQLLASKEVNSASEHERFGACSEAAVALLKLPPSVKAAAAISGYAEPLLEGCGSVKKGDLRIVAETPPIPFVTAFCSADLPEDLRLAVTEALFDVAADAELKLALETLDGFVAWQAETAKHSTVHNASTAADTAAVDSSKKK